MRRYFVIGSIALIAIVIAVVVSLSPWDHNPKNIESHQALVPGSFVPSKSQLLNLRIEPVQVRTFHSRVTAEGRLAFDDQRMTPVFSPLSGKVTRLISEPGVQVEAGQPLFAVESTEFVQGQSDLVAATAALASANAQVKLAQANETRQKALYESDAAALKDYQQAQVDWAAARSALQTAEAAVSAVRHRLRILGVSADDIARLESNAGHAVDAFVRAPISGIVTQRGVAVGQYIQSGASNPQFVIGDISQIWAIANVREGDAALIKKGQRIEARVFALPDQVFSGAVEFVSPNIDPATRRVTVRATLKNKDGVLRPEMFASIEVITSEDATRPAIPDSGLILEGNSARVWAQNDDGSLSLHEVKIGRNSDHWSEALSGIASGDKVVTSGTLFIDRAAKGN
jgi:cobalt-zinc-cadmium efflux system membrane fusion protein